MIFVEETILDTDYSRQRHLEMCLPRRRFMKLGFAATAALLYPLPIWAVTKKESNPLKSLAFYNTHTQEKLQISYSRNGKYDQASLRKIDYILRDHRNNKIKAIDTRLLDLLHAISLKTRTDKPFHVISGYRSPETNTMLRKNGRGVASRSMHMLGKAIDIRLPGFSTRRLRDAAVETKGGGVGYYAKSDFIHVDIGRVRFW